MDTEILAIILSIIETVAVVSSLLFVGVQIRDSRRTSSGNAYQAWLETVVPFYMTLAQDETLAQMYWTGRKNIKNLDETQIPRFFYLCVNWFALMENLYIQYKQGLIPSDVFLPWQHAFEEDLANNGFAEYWRLEADNFAPIFRQFVDSLKSTSDIADDKISAFYSLITPRHIEAKTEQNERIEASV